MKKIVVLLCLLLFPIIVFADDYLIRPFEAKVTNEKGVDIVGKEKIHLKKDAKIFISLEFDKDTGGTYIDNEMYKVAYKDIAPVEEEVKFSDENVMDSGIEYKLFFTAENIDVYSGPSSAYKKVGTIKEDTDLFYRYYYDPYIYVEKNELKGWINAKENNIFILGIDDFITTKEIESNCGKIPVNTIFKTPMVKAIDIYDVLVEYNGCRTLVKSLDDESMVSMINQYLVNGKKVKLYETPEFDSKVIDTIPKYAILKNLAIYYQKFEDGEGSGIATPGDRKKNRWYVEYKSVRGWIDLEEFKVFQTEKEAKREARVSKVKVVLIPSLLIVTVGACFLSFYLSGRKKGK